MGIDWEGAEGTFWNAGNVQLDLGSDYMDVYTCKNFWRCWLKFMHLMHFILYVVS